MADDRTLRAIPRVAELLAKADALLITAGAGMSVDSGLPDFRGGKGFWGAYPPLEKLGISFEHMAQPHWFAEKPEMAWAFYGHRQQLYRETKPHAGYGKLLEWGRAMSGGYFVVTSNVDGHFQAAGFPPSRVLEQHGNIHRHQCTSPCCPATWQGDLTDLKIDMDTLQAKGSLPRCPECGGLARPNVLMFGDTEWVRGDTQQQARRFERWFESVRRMRVVVLECGAGIAIPTIRRVGERAAERSRTTLVRINPQATEADEPAVPLRMTALEALTRIEAVLPENYRKRVAAAVLDHCDESADTIEWSLEGPVTTGLGEFLSPLPAKEMAIVEFPGGPDTSPAAAWLTVPAGPFDYHAITLIDLDTGRTGPFNYLGISAADEKACLDRWYGPRTDKYAPLPDVGGYVQSGFLVTGQAVSSAEPKPGRTIAGAAVMYICGPDRELIMTVGVARRPLEGAHLWRLLYESATNAPKPLEYPRVPWVAQRLDAAAAKHAAIMPVLAEVGRVMAWTWFRLVEYRDRQLREEGEG